MEEKELLSITNVDSSIVASVHIKNSTEAFMLCSAFLQLLKDMPEMCSMFFKLMAESLCGNDALQIETKQSFSDEDFNKLLKHKNDE